MFWGEGNLENRKILIKKFNASVLSSLLLALIISVNAVRFLIDIHESNLVIYSFYILFIIINLFRDRICNSILKVKILPIIIISLLVAAYSLVTGLYYEGGAIYSSFKLVISLFVSYYAINMSLPEVWLSLKYTFIICIIYSLILVFDSGKRDRYLMGGGNYLNMTLPIGLVFSIFLTRTICSFYFKKYKKYRMIYICISIFLFCTLAIFPARGSILFPFAVAILIVVVLGRKNFPQFMMIVFLSGIALFAAAQYFLYTASGFNLQHMLRLFQDLRSEDRFIIWKEYIDYVITHKWFLIGGGTNSSVIRLGFYPHNLYLQLIGEFGILGIAFSVLVTWRIIKDEIVTLSIILKNPDIEDEAVIIYFDCVSGIMYLFLTFMKSFSIYDACVLMVFSAITINVCQNCSGRIERSRKEKLNGRDIVKHCNSN